jgi:hypothetical protein
VAHLQILEGLELELLVKEIMVVQVMAMLRLMPLLVVAVVRAQ